MLPPPTAGEDVKKQEFPLMVRMQNGTYIHFGRQFGSLLHN